MKPFVIMASRYKPYSNGIKTMHKICHTINKLGGDARMIFHEENIDDCQKPVYGDNSFISPAYDTPVFRKTDKRILKNDCYVIYPEVIQGNPLNSKNVIRYFGNREGYCNGKKIKFSANDFLLSHSKSIRKDAHCVLFNAEINPVFHANRAAPTLLRTLDVTYVGKGYIYGEANTIENTVFIGRTWPVNQEQLAILLRQTRIFYTWDSWTASNIEAVLCGAIPFFMRYDPWTEEDIDGAETGRIPRLDREHHDMKIEEFAEQREALIERMAKLDASWDSRVYYFMDQVEKHFG